MQRLKLGLIATLFWTMPVHAENLAATIQSDGSAESMSDRSQVLAPAEQSDVIQMISPTLDEGRIETKEISFNDTLHLQLSTECGVGDEAEASFGKSFVKFGMNVEPLLQSILEKGVPGDVRIAFEAKTRAYYDKELAWIGTGDWNADDKDAREFTERDREDYVAAELEAMDNLYRQNAVRALGYVGGRSSIQTLSKTIEAHPELKTLGDWALSEIRGTP